jgi:hypothetical protein
MGVITIGGDWSGDGGVPNETSGRRGPFGRAGPCQAISSELTWLRFGGVGDFPCQVRILPLARAVQTRAHSPARPALTPSASPLTAGFGAGAVPPSSHSPIIYGHSLSGWWSRLVCGSDESKSTSRGASSGPLNVCRKAMSWLTSSSVSISGSSSECPAGASGAVL